MEPGNLHSFLIVDSWAPPKDVPLFLFAVVSLHIPLRYHVPQHPVFALGQRHFAHHRLQKPRRFYENAEKQGVFSRFQTV